LPFAISGIVGNGYETEKTDRLGDCSDSPAAPRQGHPEQEFDEQRAKGASRIITLGLMRGDEVATFGYPRERSC
jgi:hypothetical protein